VKANAKRRRAEERAAELAAMQAAEFEARAAKKATLQEAKECESAQEGGRGR
jgi:hypothetical protein